jgi:succinate-semialdehyde dehydrogenase / glutarate-semialdehyde dehydrogenase
VNLSLNDPGLLRHQCYIDGKWQDAAGSGILQVRNPANGEAIGTVPNMGQAETTRLGE